MCVCKRCTFLTSCHRVFYPDEGVSRKLLKAINQKSPQHRSFTSVTRLLSSVHFPLRLILSSAFIHFYINGTFLNFNTNSSTRFFFICNPSGYLPESVCVGGREQFVVVAACSFSTHVGGFEASSRKLICHSSGVFHGSSSREQRDDFAAVQLIMNEMNCEQ